MSNIKNIKKSISNTISAATSIVSVSTELLADTSLYISKSIEHTPAVLKSIGQSPFSATKGYIMESEGVDADVAEQRAFKYLNQELSVTINETSEGAGKLIADMFADDEPNDNTDDKSAK